MTNAWGLIGQALPDVSMQLKTVWREYSCQHGITLPWQPRFGRVLVIQGFGMVVPDVNVSCETFARRSSGRQSTKNIANCFGPEDSGCQIHWMKEMCRGTLQMTPLILGAY